jgi:iron complex outermembrane receptor protein
VLKTRMLYCGAVITASLISCASFVYADEANENDESGSKVEEVVVTAQRRQERLQNVPISAQVVSSKALAEQNQNSLENLAQTVPGVQVSSDVFSNDLYIRGVGSGPNVSFDQSVATFVDDIYHGRSRMSGATFLDLDRIEVLKGPQSTYFGNNAIAGALNIVTKKPGDKFEGWVRALYGMFGQYAVEGAVTTPVSEVLSVRVAGTFNGERGWIENVNTASHAPNEHDKAGRFSLLYTPVEDFDVDLKVEGGRNKVSGSPNQVVNCSPPSPFTVGGVNSGCPVALALGVPIGVNNDENAGLAGQGSTLSTFEGVLTTNYRRWGNAFTSVTGYNSYRFDSQYDQYQLPVALLTNIFPERYHQFSQEVRMASAADQPLEYLVGAYFQTDHVSIPLEANAPVANGLASVPGFTALAPYIPLGLSPNSSQEEHIYSIFGSVNWHITDALKLNAGLRGSWVRKSFSGDLSYGSAHQTFGGFVPLPAELQVLGTPIYGVPGGAILSRGDDAWMPSAGLQYQIAPAVMAYFSYSRGFKSGGFNGEEPSQNVNYGPEHVNAYELGVKSKWADDALLVNLDVFRSNYKGLQVDSFFTVGAVGGVTTVAQEIQNAAASLTEGVELETQWVPVKGIHLTANATYLDSHYVDYPNAPAGTLQAYCGNTNYALPDCSIYPQPVASDTSLSGVATNYAPRWSGSVTAAYTVLLPRNNQITFALMPFATAHFAGAYGNANDRFYQQAGYLRLDGRLSLESADGHWSFDIIGKNLTNRIILETVSRGLAAKQEPANAAAQLRYQW